VRVVGKFLFIKEEKRLPFDDSSSDSSSKSHNQKATKGNSGYFSES
jgi:hypothetical protein